MPNFIYRILYDLLFYTYIFLKFYLIIIILRVHAYIKKIKIKFK
jgi:hypothetical protein